MQPFNIDKYIEDQIEIVKLNKGKYQRFYNNLIKEFDAQSKNKNHFIIIVGEIIEYVIDQNVWYDRIDFLEHKAVENFIHYIQSKGHKCDYTFHWYETDYSYTMWKEIDITL